MKYLCNFDSGSSELIMFFCVQVIDYVHYMQEKVQKYEGSYQGWVSEPSKLMPWVKFDI